MEHLTTAELLAFAKLESERALDDDGMARAAYNHGDRLAENSYIQSAQYHRAKAREYAAQAATKVQ